MSLLTSRGQVLPWLHGVLPVCRSMIAEHRLALADSAERAPFLRLFFEVYVQAMNHPEAYSARGRAMVTEWLDQFGAALTRSTGQANPATATLAIAVLRGLVLDRLNPGDEVRTDQALELFARLTEPTRAY